MHLIQLFHARLFLARPGDLRMQLYSRNRQSAFRIFFHLADGFVGVVIENELLLTRCDRADIFDKQIRRRRAPNAGLLCVRTFPCISRTSEDRKQPRVIEIPGQRAKPRPATAATEGSRKFALHLPPFLFRQIRRGRRTFDPVHVPRSINRNER